jgi:hypothetical protein
MSGTSPGHGGCTHHMPTGGRLCSLPKPSSLSLCLSLPHKSASIQPCCLPYRVSATAADGPALCSPAAPPCTCFRTVLLVGRRHCGLAGVCTCALVTPCVRWSFSGAPVCCASCCCYFSPFSQCLLRCLVLRLKAVMRGVQNPAWKSVGAALVRLKARVFNLTSL